MKKSALILVSLVLLLNSCDILNQLGEAKRFAQCDFYISDVRIVKLGDIDVSDYKSVSDFGFSDLLLLGQKILTDKLPATLAINIAAINNQNSKAAISGLQWILFMKGEQYGSGKLNEYIEVLPSQSTTFPVSVEFDFLKLLHSENLQSILDLIVDQDNKEKLQKLDIVIKVKPSYKSGNQIKEYPGYLSIRP